MTILIDNVTTYAPWIYFVCGVVALYQMYRTWIVRTERRQAVFSLEREKAVRDLGNIFTTAMVLLVIMGATYFASTTLAKAIEPLVAQTVSPDPPLDFIPTPTNTPLPETPTPILIAGLTPEVEETVAEPTATPTVAPVAVTLPTNTPAPIVQAPVCATGNAIILRPGANETIRGMLTVVGTASHTNFQYYKIEYALPGTENWNYLSGDQNQVINGVLANIDTGVLSNGAWTIRLVVVDQTGNFPEPCQVNIFIDN